MASGLNVRLGTLACAIRRLARTKCESFNVSSSAVPRLAAGHAVVQGVAFAGRQAARHLVHDCNDLRYDVAAVALGGIHSVIY